MIETLIDIVHVLNLSLLAVFLLAAISGMLVMIGDLWR